jgi:hypothetical protein
MDHEVLSPCLKWLTPTLSSFNSAHTFISGLSNSVYPAMSQSSGKDWRWGGCSLLLFSWWRRQCRWNCGLCCSLVPHLIVIGKREPRGWERNYPSTALPTPDSISSALEWNAGSCDEKPVTNPLSRGTTSGMQVSAMHPLQILLHPLGICKISKANMLISLLIKPATPTAATCCLCWTAMVGKS